MDKRKEDENKEQAKEQTAGQEQSVREMKDAQGNKIDPVQLANEIYDLDCKVYKAVGSSLGRVFGTDKERSVNMMVGLMGDSSDQHILRSEVALIGNMARTIDDKQARSEALTSYSKIMDCIHQISVGYNTSALIDRSAASLNELNLFNRFSKDDQLVICISRSYGSGGSEIGFGLADRLHIDYYDAEIFKRVLQRLEAEKDSLVDESDFASNQIATKRKGTTPELTYEKDHLTFKEKLKRLSRYHGLPTRDAVFFNQSDLLCGMASSEDFVVMGRCADVVLTNARIPHISIFITAPEEQRIRRMMEVNQVSYKKARAQLHQVDHIHAQYYADFTGREWGNAGNYDLCINSSAYGVKGSIDFIMKMLRENKITNRE